VEQIVGVKKGTIERSAAGVKERHWADPDITNSMMGAMATREAVDDAGITLEDIDLIINASGTFEQAVPDGGALLQRELGLSETGIPCFTVHSTCLSFLTALNIAGNFLANKQYDRILIVSSEIVIRCIERSNLELMSIIGDLAAAAVVTRPEPGETSRLLNCHFATYSQGADLTYCNVGTKNFPGAPDARLHDTYFNMMGRQIFSFAHRYIPVFLEQLRPGLSKGLGTIDLVVPHQASGMALRSLKRFRWSKDKIVITLDRMGNTSASTIPGALYEAKVTGRLERGMEVLMIGTGAGITIGGVILTY
jgi:3-oxoacyl-[acyl-carrier-protein] synthase-3